jgi:hypothetical protein
MSLGKNTAGTLLVSSSTWTLVFLLALVACSSKHGGRDSSPVGDANQHTNQASLAAVDDEGLADARANSESQGDPPPTSSGNTPADLAKQLDEANKSFTYKAKPINPRAVNELLVWISDSVDEPGPIAIDLSSTYDTNRYYGAFKKENDGAIFIDLTTVDAYCRKEDLCPAGYFSYKRLGTLKDGVHVLETWDGGGGSGVFTCLLLIKFSIDFEYTENGSRRYRLAMQRLGEIPLGDRYGGHITIQTGDNTIRIGPGAFPSGEKIPGKVIRIR